MPFAFSVTRALLALKLLVIKRRASSDAGRAPKSIPEIDGTGPLFDADEKLLRR